MQNDNLLRDGSGVAMLFSEIFGYSPTLCCFAPGRINLIGEHTDYNGGRVFPCAIHLGITAAAAPRCDGTWSFYSRNFQSDGVIVWDSTSWKSDGRWTDYPKGVICTFIAFGYSLPCGADVVFDGNLPDGAGLSSSAALEVLTGTLLKELFAIPVTPQQIAVMGQFAENRFIGVNCGIMDQFASAMGRRHHALMLDTHTLACEYAPIDSSMVSVVIINSGVKHSLASSAYNDRRRECESALAALCESGEKISSLCSLTPEAFEQRRQAIPDEICRRRAHHAVYENSRTLQAARALREGDIETFGQLMKDSHLSLRDDYEVSCEELDFLAETAWKTEGVFGARMTGGGFGGCTVNLVRPEAVTEFIAQITAAYEARFGIRADSYVVTPSDGARRL